MVSIVKHIPTKIILHSPTPNHYHYLFSLPLQSPLTFASREGHTEVAALLLQAKGINVNKGVSIMISAPSMSPFIPLPLTAITIFVEYLCVSSFHLQEYCYEYDTPLASAARNGHIEIVAMLLQAEGIDVNYMVIIFNLLLKCPSPHLILSLTPIIIRVTYLSHSSYSHLSCEPQKMVIPR